MSERNHSSLFGFLFGRRIREAEAAEASNAVYLEQENLKNELIREQIRSTRLQNDFVEGQGPRKSGKNLNDPSALN